LLSGTEYDGGVACLVHESGFLLICYYTNRLFGPDQPPRYHGDKRWAAVPGKRGVGWPIEVQAPGGSAPTLHRTFHGPYWKSDLLWSSSKHPIASLGKTSG